MNTHRAPAQCPVCHHALITLRLGCPECGTEVSGHFETCRFCQMSDEDRQVVELFLQSRGNLRDVQAHWGVSYPTARQPFSELLARIGLGAEPSPVDRDAVLADLAAGRITVADAEAVLG